MTEYYSSFRDMCQDRIKYNELNSKERNEFDKALCWQKYKGAEGQPLVVHCTTKTFDLNDINR